MPLDDRDYMRKRSGFEPLASRRPWWRKLSLKALIAGIVALASVVGVVTLLVSDLSYLGSFLPSREGAFIVNVNTASVDELETLPGIGPALATRIIAGRPYETVEDLEEVYGIGPALVESLRPWVVVEGETRKR